MGHAQNRTRGIICLITSALCFAVMNMSVRLAGDLPTMEKAFFRNAVALVIAVTMLIRTHTGLKWQQGNFKYQFLRAFFGTVGLIGNFYAIDHLVLSDSSMLNKLSPFFAVIFSFFFLGEKMKPMQIVGVIVAFIGSLFIIKPTGVHMNYATLAGMVGGMGAGLAYAMVRKLGLRGERGEYIVFFFSAFSCLVMLPFVIFDFKPIALPQLAALMGAGISAAGGQFSVTAAYSYAPAREISVYDYTNIIFAALLGFFVLGQLPDMWSIIGYGIIIGAAVVMFFYNKRQKH